MYVCMYVCMTYVCTYTHMYTYTQMYKERPRESERGKNKPLGSLFGPPGALQVPLGSICMYGCMYRPTIFCMLPTEDDDVMELPVKLPVRASSQRPRDAQRASERHRDAQRGQLRRRNTFLSSCEKDLCNRQYVLSKDMTIMSWTICACRSLWPRDKP